MASPQRENGFTAIANEILEHLIQPGINGSELKLLLFVIRKTYGFGKKWDKISLSQFTKGLLSKRASICRTIKSAVAKRLLLKANNGFKLNKNWEEWVVAKRLHSSQMANRVVAKRLHTKETITKENKPSPAGDANIMPLKEYNENQFQDDIEQIDIDIGEKIEEDPRLKKIKNVNKKFWELIKWAENRRGGKFPSWKLQIKAISQLKDADIEPSEIKNRWIELENDKFYKDKLDFRAITISFDKKA